MKSTITNCVILPALIFFISLNISAKENPGSSLLHNRPVRFLENKGQMKDMNKQPVSHVLFKASTPHLDLYITETGITYVFLEIEEEEENEIKSPDMPEEKHKVSWEKIEMNLKDAKITRNNIITEGSSIAAFNYYFGNESIQNVKEYEKITIKNVYEGIDWVFYNSAKTGFKYDFIVHTGADPSLIQMVYNSSKPLELDNHGNLNILSELGGITEQAPQTFFSEDKLKVSSSFKIKSNKKGKKYESTVSFKIDEKALLAKKELIIDPQLVWATFYGGSDADGSISMDTDPSGNIFMCGYTISTDLPVLDAGTFFQGIGGSTFILKFSNTGVLLWGTYTSVLTLNSLATDNSGNVFVVGATLNSVCPLLNSGTFFQPSSAGSWEACILKFNNTGLLLWGTYYGGSQQDEAYSVDVDNLGNIFVAGVTLSSDFPLQNAATYYQGIFGTGSHGFILKFDNLGNRLWATYYEKLVSTYLTTDKNNNVIITGTAQPAMQVQNPGGTTYFQSAPTSTMSDSYILKFDNLGNRLWATYYGGSNHDHAIALVTDKNNNIFITGMTASTNLPIQNAGTFFQSTLTSSIAGNGFILKFNASGTLLWGTYFGGSTYELMSANGDNIAIDTCGNIYVTMSTASPNMPLMNACEGGFQDNFKENSQGQGVWDIFVARFSNNGDLQWGTYFGGRGYDYRSPLAVDQSGDLFVTGEWCSVPQNSSFTYPTVDPGFGAYYDSTANGSDELFIVKFKNTTLPLTFTYTSSVCAGAYASMVPIFSSSVSLANQFTSAPGLSIHPQTGVISASASIGGTYVVSCSYPFCICSVLSTSIATATVIIKPAPPVAITGSNTICIGTIGTRTATGASTYTWGTGATTNTIGLQSNSNIILTVSGTGSNGCVGTATALVKVNSCVGMDDFEIGKTKVSIFANPNQGRFTVQSEADIQLYLVNVLGQEIQKITLTESNERKVIVNGLSEGVYFIKNSSNDQPLNYKIVVQK